MARYIPSGIGVGELRGSIGSETFARNPHGAYVRARTTPLYPGTSMQLFWAGRMATVMAGWASLSDSQRESWISAAASGAYDKIGQRGHLVRPTGVNLYVSLNLAISFIGGSFSTPPPLRSISPSDFPVPARLSWDATNQLNIIFSSTSIASGLWLWVFATAPLSAGVMRPRKSLFTFLTASPSSPVSNPFNVFSTYVAKYGTPLTGQKTYVLIKLLDSTTGLFYTRGLFSTIYPF